MKIETTSDYGKFVSNHEQRPIDALHAKRIAQNMTLFGFLPSKPIQCYKKGQKYVVVDGHHRLEAAKSVGVPVCFVVESDRCQTTMAAENLLVKKWAGIDFVRLYASRGNKNFQELLRYQEIGIPVNMAASMLINNGAGSGNANRMIQDGTFKIKTTDTIEKVVDLINEFSARNPAVKSRPFIAAISKCIMWEGFSFDTFVRRMRENSMMIEKTSNEEQMLIQIDAAYNYRSRRPVSLKFEVEQAAKARNIRNLKKDS